MRKSISIASLCLALVAMSFSVYAEGDCIDERGGQQGFCVELSSSAPLSGGDYYCDTELPYSVYDCLGLPSHA